MWCYNSWQPLSEELHFKYSLINFARGLTIAVNDDRLFLSHKISTIIEMIRWTLLVKVVKIKVPPQIHTSQESDCHVLSPKYLHLSEKLTFYKPKGIVHNSLWNNPGSMTDYNLWWGKWNQACQISFQRLLRMQQRMGYVAVELNDSAPKSFSFRAGLSSADWQSLSFWKKVSWIWIKMGW